MEQENQQPKEEEEEWTLVGEQEEDDEGSSVKWTSLTSSDITDDFASFAISFDASAEEDFICCSQYQLDQIQSILFNASSISTSLHTEQNQIEYLAAIAFELEAKMRASRLQLHHFQALMHVICAVIIDQLEALYQKKHITPEQYQAMELTSHRQQLEKQLATLAGTWATFEHPNTTSLADLDQFQSTLQFGDDRAQYIGTLNSLQTADLCIPLTWLRQQTGQDDPTTSHFATAGEDLGILGRLGLVTQDEAFQDSKDLQRDQIRINGTLIQGVHGGYEVIVKTMASQLAKAAMEVSSRFGIAVDEHGESVKTDEDRLQVYSAMAQRVLQIVNRTHSGGTSYEVLEHLIRHPEFSILRPKSIAAQPLEVEIDIGPYIYHSTDPETLEKRTIWAFGLRASVEAHTAYAVCDAHDPMIEWCVIDAVFQNQLALSIGMSPYTGPHTDRAARVDEGVVRLDIRSSDLGN